MRTSDHPTTGGDRRTSHGEVTLAIGLLLTAVSIAGVAAPAIHERRHPAVSGAAHTHPDDLTVNAPLSEDRTRALFDDMSRTAGS